ncbi:MAG: hypothetical protein PUD07_01005 [bacterium]|nr:hypothetical protein [bacterium]
MERLEYITQKKEKLQGELNKSIIKKDDISKIHKLESQINELNFQIMNFQKKQNNTNLEVKNNINQRSIFNIINQHKK